MSTKKIVLLAALAGAAPLATASVRASAMPNDAPALGDFGGVLKVSASFLGSGTAVEDGKWVITARHVVTTDGTNGGTPNAAGNITVDWGAGAKAVAWVHTHPSADIALLRLADMAPTSHEIYCHDREFGEDETGSTFIGVGFGQGAGPNAPGPFTANMATRPQFDGIYGTKRYYRNTVEGIIPGPLSHQGMVIDYDFDDPAAAMSDAIAGEGLSAPGDSGGGIFFQDPNDVWQLGGIISSGTGPWWNGRSSAVHIGTYKDWIGRVIPTPPAAALLAVGGLAATRRRR